MAEREQCSERVYGRDHGWGGSRCARWAVNTERGKPWCKQHTPSLVAARSAEKAAEYEAQQVARRARREAERLQEQERDRREDIGQAVLDCGCNHCADLTASVDAAQPR